MSLRYNAIMSHCGRAAVLSAFEEDPRASENSIRVNLHGEPRSELRCPRDIEVCKKDVTKMSVLDERL